MILIDENLKNGILIKYYDGIDYEMIKNHSKDGSGGFLYFFINRWIDEIKIYNRDKKINSILNNSEWEFDPGYIENNYIVIYQTDGQTMEIYKTIRERENHIVGDFTFAGIKRELNGTLNEI